MESNYKLFGLHGYLALLLLKGVLRMSRINSFILLSAIATAIALPPGYVIAAGSCGGCPSTCLDSFCDPTSTPCDVQAQGDIGDNVCCGCGTDETNSSKCKVCENSGCSSDKDGEGNGGACCGPNCDPFEADGDTGT